MDIPAAEGGVIEGLRYLILHLDPRLAPLKGHQAPLESLIRAWRPALTGTARAVDHRARDRHGRLQLIYYTILYNTYMHRKFQLIDGQLSMTDE